MVLLAPTPDRWTPACDRINAIGVDLAAARTRLGLTAVQQAAAVGIGAPTLAGLVDGSSNPTKATLVSALRWLSANR